jgi:hypothetical protein
MPRVSSQADHRADHHYHAPRRPQADSRAGDLVRAGPAGELPEGWPPAPCAEWFAGQDASYRQGESVDHRTLYSEFGLTAEHVVVASTASLAWLGDE